MLPRLPGVRRILALIFLLTTALAAQQAPVPRKPKLVLAIVVDQFRYDFLTRYRSEYTGGLNRLLTRGASYTNANYEQSVTVTAVGHSTLLSGAFPSVSGIIANEWFDPAAGKRVSAVTDDTVKFLGGSTEGGSSPRRMLVNTVGDELKIATNGKSRVIGISLKARSAILPVGHMADGAFWVEAQTGNIVSSSYYFADLPAWVKELNKSKPADRHAGVDWIGHKMLQAGREGYYASLAATPFSNDLVELMAEKAIASEKLGEGQATDLLAVSFSANDYVGHVYGPDSAEAHDTAVRTDKALDKLFRYLETRIGMQNVLVVLTADHGVAPAPELSIQRRIGGGRMPPRIVQDTVQAKLDERFGKAKWILDTVIDVIFFDRNLIRQKKIDPAEFERVAADAARSVPNVARVYTRLQLMANRAMGDQIGQRVMHSFHPVRSGDLLIIPEPNWMYSVTGTTHGSPYNYDSHVPMIFMGPGIKPGKYNNRAAPNDIAPTLATMLEVEIPSGSSGRVLDEMLKP
jgi:predicted AlkP superfamily pyrophosphatase or phosphodiesterase